MAASSGWPAHIARAVTVPFRDPGPRLSVALEAYGRISEATLQRAKGWAVLFGVFLLDTGLSDNPRNAGIGARTLRRVTESM